MCHGQMYNHKSACVSNDTVRLNLAGVSWKQFSNSWNKVALDYETITKLISMENA